MTKVAFKSFYLLNKLPTNLVLKGGYINIPVGTYKKVLESDLEHPDVGDAITREWVEVHSEVPDTSSLPKVIEPVIEHDGYRGMTAEELKDSKDEVKESTARSEALGRTEGVEKTSEPMSVAIGKSAEEANGVAEVEKSKRGRKAATE